MARLSPIANRQAARLERTASNRPAEPPGRSALEAIQWIGNSGNSISWWVIIALWITGLASLFWVWLKLREMKREQHPDPEAVLAQRQLYADGEFLRRWTRRTPRDLNLDRLDLECGHWTYQTAGCPLDPGELVQYPDCAKKYLKSVRKGLEKRK